MHDYLRYLPPCPCPKHILRSPDPVMLGVFAPFAGPRGLDPLNRGVYFTPFRMRLAPFFNPCSHLQDVATIPMGCNTSSAYLYKAPKGGRWFIESNEMFQCYVARTSRGWVSSTVFDRVFDIYSNIRMVKCSILCTASSIRDLNMFLGKAR